VGVRVSVVCSWWGMVRS